MMLCLLQNRLILDLINEPDAYGASWTESGELEADVGNYYLAAMDALYAVCPGCLFQIQGSGMHVCALLHDMYIVHICVSVEVRACVRACVRELSPKKDVHMCCT